MSYINNEVINEIRNKNDIVEVISKYVALVKRGKNYFGICPFHDDNHPSMSVSGDKQIYTCFSCGATGNVFTFVADYEHISFIEAVKLLGEKVGYNLDNVKTEKKSNLDYRIYEDSLKFYQNNLYSNLGKNAISYLEKRKIDKDTINKFKIGLSVNKVSLTDYLINKKYNLDDLIRLGLTNEKANDIFIGRIMFPIHDLNGNVVAFSGRIYNTHDPSKYVNSRESNIFKKGKILYNYHRVREHLKKNDSIIIMEGFMDVIRASTFGINNCLATMGTALTKDHVDILKKMTDNIILCFDGDEAGEKATIAALSLLENYNFNIKIVRLENNLDPDEYILTYGKDKFLNKINNAINVIDYKMELLKSNRDFNNIEDISKYIESSLIEISKIDDDIVIELTLKKLSDTYNIEYDTLKNKLDKLKSKNIKKKEENKDVTIPKKNNNRYDMASEYLINYMLKDETVINMVDNKVIYFPRDNIRYLASEIIYYYHKYGIIDVADFISYLASNSDLLDTLTSILSKNLKEKYTIEEIEDYIYVVNEYPKEMRIEELNTKLKKEDNPLQQAKILKEIMEIKGVKL